MKRTSLLLVVSLSALFILPAGVFAQLARNTNQSRALRSVIGGGVGNLIPVNTSAAFVGCGTANIAGGSNAVVAGGKQNSASLPYAVVGGGYQNTNGTWYGTIGGGYQNSCSGAGYATIGGGLNNVASGFNATVPGGARGKATNTGSFVWSGDGLAETSSFGDYTFTVRATGGARFYTAAGTNTYASLAGGSGAWTAMSDRNAKANFQKVNATDVLAKVAAIPVMTWNYKTQDERIRHIGPTAQDFRAAFGVGETDTGITTVDADGVALAAIQGLVEELKERDVKHASDLAERDKTIRELGSKLQAVEDRLNSLPPQ